jgi:protein CpxP
MRTYFKPIHSIVLAGVLSTLAGYSMAQQAPSSAPMMAATHGQGMGQRDPAKMQERMTKRLADVKAKLQITPAQEAAWTTYTDALKPKPREPREAIAATRADLSKLSTPERLDRMRALHAERMAEMTARMDERTQATKTFYADLSADQKKVFDDQFERAFGGHGGHRMGPMGGQHGRHHG